MKKHKKPNSCLNCVFFRKRCVLGLRRPWNQISCMEFRPYCLDCVYPHFFCHTCPNRISQKLRPGPIGIVDHRPDEYVCTWSKDSQ